MSFQTKIENRLKSIVDTEMYSPEQVTELAVILNTKFEPSVHKVYRLIQGGNLPATNMAGSGSQPRWFVEGRDLKKFVKSKFSN